MPLALQARLLRVLQENEVKPLGGTETRTVDVRIISATNRDLGQAIADGTFREDLFYRLNVLPLRLPPLRERTGDIPELLDYFLKRDAARLCMRAAVHRVPALGHDAPVPDQDRADPGVRRGESPAAFGQFQRPGHKGRLSTHRIPPGDRSRYRPRRSFRPIRHRDSPG